MLSSCARSKRVSPKVLDAELDRPKLGLSRAVESEMRAIATVVKRIGHDHQFCQIYKVADQNGVTREFRMPDKLRAAQLLAQHCGWDEPTKVALDVSDSLSAFLREVVPK